MHQIAYMMQTHANAKTFMSILMQNLSPILSKYREKTANKSFYSSHTTLNQIQIH